jgi:ferredoxin
MFILRSESFKDGFYPILCQAKLGNNVHKEQPHALRAIMPELLYHESRDTQSPKQCTNLSVEEWTAWVAVRKGLLQCDEAGKNRRRSVIRFMMQYPSRSTNSARPGVVACGECGVCKSACQEHNEHLDRLVTIDQDNADTLFVDNKGKEGAMLQFLTSLKKVSQYLE